MKQTLKWLSVSVFTVLAVTGAAAVLFCLRCIPMEIVQLRENLSDISGPGFFAAVFGTPVVIFFLLLLIFMIVFLIVEARKLWKKLRCALTEETYLSYWNYTVMELTALVINGFLFWMIGPLSLNFVNSTDSRFTLEYVTWIILFLLSAICAITALIISYREKRYE